MGTPGVGDDDVDTREEIMSATYRALCEHGYGDLTMAKIADEADVSKALLHYHYDTKRGLMLSFFEWVLEWIDDRVTAHEGETPLGQLDALLDVFVEEDDAENSFTYALFELRLRAVHDPELRERLVATHEAFVDELAAVIGRGAEAGSFRPVDPERTAALVYALMDGARFHQVTLDRGGASERAKRAVLDYLVAEAAD